MKFWAFFVLFCFFFVFFLAKFSFTNIHDSQVSRGKERVSIFVECVVLTSNCVSAMGNNLRFCLYKFRSDYIRYLIRSQSLLILGAFRGSCFLTDRGFFLPELFCKRLSCQGRMFFTLFISSQIWLYISMQSDSLDQLRKNEAQVLTLKTFSFTSNHLLFLLNLMHM